MRAGKPVWWLSIAAVDARLATGANRRLPNASQRSILPRMPAKISPSRDLRVGRSKTGLGLFTCVPIKKGQFIIRYRGRKIPTEITDDLDNRYMFEINSRWTIDGANRATSRATSIIPAGRIPRSISSATTIKIRAIKNIKPDTELSYNYGRNYVDMLHQAGRLQVHRVPEEEGQGPCGAKESFGAEAGESLEEAQRESGSSFEFFLRRACFQACHGRACPGHLAYVGTAMRPCSRWPGQQGVYARLRGLCPAMTRKVPMRASRRLPWRRSRRACRRGRGI